jgi:hypothetical protein
MEKSYTISRFESQGDSLFISINSLNNPVYIEHFFDENEKLDIPATIERLVAELEIKDSEYVAPLPRIDRLEEAKALTISKTKIAQAKTAIVAEKARIEEERLEAIKEMKTVEILQENDIIIP